MTKRLFLKLQSVLVTLLAFGAPHGAYAADHCSDCHTAAPAQTTSSECARCHEHSPVPHVPAGAADGETPNRQSLPIPTVPGLPPGMIYPLYPAESRLGDQPNAMVLIPAGVFYRGTDERLADEGPRHLIDLPAYWIDQFEVTNFQYARFLREARRRGPDHFDNGEPPAGKADHPVTFVSWFDADRYCRWAKKRLPTDQEWEKAARGADARVFPWGNEFVMHAANTPVRWQSLQQAGDTTPVGAFPAGQSPYGLFDMSGNVWEWTASWYTAYPGNTRPNENYGEKYRTLKGGSWWDCSFYKCGISAPVYNRAFFNPRVQNASFGFRCAKDEVESTNR